MKTIGMMYLTLASPIIAGILNMVWCKLNLFNIPNVPMDMNNNFIDGKRIFGNNKTWKGFFGYIVLNYSSEGKTARAPLGIFQTPKLLCF